MVYDKPETAPCGSRAGACGGLLLHAAFAGSAAIAPYAAAAAVLLAVIAIVTVLASKRHLRTEQSSDGRYKALIDQANDGVVIVDAASYRVLYANPAFLRRLEYSNEEAAALTLLGIFSDGDSSAESCCRASRTRTRKWR